MSKLTALFSMLAKCIVNKHSMDAMKAVKGA